MATWAEAAADPLIVRQPLEDELGLSGIAVERASAGHSNLTFFIEAGECRLVLRRPPRGPLSPSAHDVLREHRILAALADSGVPAPRVVAACEDERVIGAPFYVMERVDGVVIHGETPPPLDNAGDRARIGEELVDALLALHRVDWRGSQALRRIGRGDGYLERQLNLWGDQWARQKTREVPLIEEVGAALLDDSPDSPPDTLVHGDFKLDNVVFAASSPARLVAILDWEMATIGDPLADLGFFTATWLQGDDPKRLVGLSAATAEPGYPTRAELAERYARASGLPVEAHLAWYQALALWKLAILLEASYRRFKSGTTEDPFFARLETAVPELADQARAALGGALLS